MISSLFIENVGVIVTMDDDGTELLDQHLLIKDQTIKAIGPDLVAPPQARVIDG